jgi:dihydrofolate synthase/folylpolyglutamate synthase
MGDRMTSLSIREIEERLLTRWPETKLEPSLDRIAKVMALLGDPQKTYRSVHITGTNGKTSTARMVEALLAASGERTGRLTSPHLTHVRERIGIAEEVIGVPAFQSAYTAVAEQAELVDATVRHPLSFFEMTVAMAYRAFIDAAVDVAVVEVGMGGRWDATNVIDADVAVVLPVDLDHTDYLGPTTAAIAAEKAGIIKAGSVAISARQSEDVADVLRARARSVGARLAVQGEDFSLLRRTAVGGGQVISVRGLYGTYRNVLLALHGRHQAENAASAIAAAEAVLGRELDLGAVRAGLGGVASPGRFDVRPGTPPVILDAAHNPHGTRALVESLAELAPCRTFAVIAAMEDKNIEGMLQELEPVIDVVVCTRNSSPRSLAPAKLAAAARQVFGAQRIHVAFNVATAIEKARALAAPLAGHAPDALVLITGSVVTVGDANRVLPAVSKPPMGRPLPG